MSPTYFSSNSPSGKKIAEAIERLKVKKQSLRLSNKQIADNSKGVLSESAIQRFFSGENLDPSMQTFVEIATAMGMTLEEAFGIQPASPVVSHHHVDHDVCERRILEQKSHYEEQLTQCRSRYKEQISDLKDNHAKERSIFEEQSCRQTKWLVALFSAFLTLVAGILFVIVYDITHPDAGWVTYAALVGYPTETTASLIIDFLRRLFYGIL